MPAALEDDDQTPHLRFERLYGTGDLYPFAAVARKFDFRHGGEHRTRAADEYLRLAFEAEHFHPHAEIVRFALVERHAVAVPRAHGKAGVLHAVDSAHAQHHIGRIVFIHPPCRADVVRACAEHVPIFVLHLPHHDGHRAVVKVVCQIFKFERIVDDHFGVQTAVRRLVDVLEKETVQVLADRDALLFLVERVLDHRCVSPMVCCLHSNTRARNSQRTARKNAWIFCNFFAFFERNDNLFSRNEEITKAAPSL